MSGLKGIIHVYCHLTVEVQQNYQNWCPLCLQWFTAASETRRQFCWEWLCNSSCMGIRFSAAVALTLSACTSSVCVCLQVCVRADLPRVEGLGVTAVGALSHFCQVPLWDKIFLWGLFRWPNIQHKCPQSHRNTSTDKWTWIGVEQQGHSFCRVPWHHPQKMIKWKKGERGLWEKIFLHKWWVLLDPNYNSRMIIIFP